MCTGFFLAIFEFECPSGIFRSSFTLANTTLRVPDGGKVRRELQHACNFQNENDLKEKLDKIDDRKSFTRLFMKFQYFLA